MLSKERRTMKMKTNHYVLVSIVLFRLNFDGVLLRCLDNEKPKDVIQEFHNEVCGGHFSSVVTAYKIIRACFYWTTMFKDSYKFVRKCIPCHTFSRKMKRVAMPLHTTMVDKPFSPWGLYVIGLINPKSSKGHSYIITPIDYFTKWQEVLALRNVDSKQLIHFFKENILSRFGVPKKIITNTSSIFIGSKFTKFRGEYVIIMRQSSNYYSQGNRLVESTNKTLIQIIKKTIESNHKNWHKKLIDALWASRLTPKDSTWHYLYTLIYGREARLPLHI
jgi:hypothetical protein